MSYMLCYILADASATCGLSAYGWERQKDIEGKVNGQDAVYEKLMAQQKFLYKLSKQIAKASKADISRPVDPTLPQKVAVPPDKQVKLIPDTPQ